MKNKIQIASKFINKAHIARQLGLSRSYVVMLLSGERTNKIRLQQIKDFIKKEVKGF